MTRPNRARLALALLAVIAAAPAFSQSTSAGIGGLVRGGNGQPIAGAEVTITHAESGTVNHAVTDASGRYNARGLRVGGPYTVVIDKAGAGHSSQSNVYLGLDQVAEVDATLGANAASGTQPATLDRIVVVGKANARTFSPDNKGIGTNLSRADLERIPAPDRSIQNVVRADPRIVVTDRDRGAFSAMGQNFRYNSITVDQVNAGDPFGLNDNGLPTKGTPISPDAIESYNISTANYDVVTRRGVGAVVNAVTKSGTNDFHGSLYYAFQDADTMIGKDQAGAKWTGYGKNTTKGFTIGGPILKDKLFFFASYEESKKTSPGSIYGTADSNAAIKIPGLTQAGVDKIVAIAKSKGLNPGDNAASGSDLDSKRALAKFDWNINDSHRLSLRLSRTKEFEPIISSGSSASGGSPLLALSSNWYALDKSNTSFSLSSYDDWSEKFSTEATVAYNDFKQTRGPLSGGSQPSITVRTSVPPTSPAGAPPPDTGPGVVFGTETFSQANQLAVKTWSGNFAANLFLGNHVIKGGFDYQKDEFYNLFLPNDFGSYEFSSIADFQNGIYRRYRLNTPAPGYTLNNIAAVFNQKQYGLFLQDTWKVNDKLSVQFGARYDVPHVNPLPTFNPCFAAAPGAASLGPKIVGSTTVCGLRSNPANPAAAVGGYGFTNQGTIDGNSVVQPRFSFNYALDESSQIRGGAGLFVSNTPAVWVANPYSNNGVSQANYDVNNRKTPADPAFSSDPLNQNIPGAVRTPPGLGTSQGMNLSVVDPNFKLPSVAKYTLAFDKELAWKHVVFSAEYEHLQVVNGILYENLNLGAPTGILPDGRLSYAKTPGAVPGGGNTSRYNSNPSFGQQVILLTNTNKGESDNFTLSLRKPFANNWSASVAYTRSRATDVNPGTSSIANSSFQNRDWINPNDDYAAVSNYSIPNRVIAQVAWQHFFFGHYATSVSAFYDGHSGAPYSWTFGNDVNGDSYFHDLAYIPAGPSDIQWTPNTTKTAGLIDSFFQYIAKDPNLSKHQGSIFNRNEARAPWISQLDLSLKQQIPGFAVGQKAELRLDFFNVLNMINKNWGVEHRAGFPLERPLANYAGVDPTTGKYIYDISGSAYNLNGKYSPQPLPVNESQNPSQRWSVLATFRYTF
jgi:outer membrane receptor protein involved in Fe transport